MAEVRHEEVFQCSPEQFFDLLVDYENYPRFLSDVKSCRVLGEENGKKRVEYQVSVVKTFTYVNEHRETRPTEVAWTFIEGDIFKSMHGHWRLSETDQGHTRAEYFVEGRFGLLVPKAITKKVLSVNLPAMMKAYHQRVKELYGEKDNG